MSSRRFISEISKIFWAMPRTNQIKMALEHKLFQYRNRECISEIMHREINYEEQSTL